MTRSERPGSRLGVIQCLRSFVRFGAPAADHTAVLRRLAKRHHDFTAATRSMRKRTIVCFLIEGPCRRCYGRTGPPGSWRHPPAHGDRCRMQGARPGSLLPKSDKMIGGRPIVTAASVKRLRHWAPRLRAECRRADYRRVGSRRRRRHPPPPTAGHRSQVRSHSCGRPRMRTGRVAARSRQRSTTTCLSHGRVVGVCAELRWLGWLRRRVRLLRRD